MTPLAHYIVRDLLQKEADRRFNDGADVARRLSDVHCFDVSEAMEVVDTLSVSFKDGGSIDARTSFLPAPKTWIECKGAHGARLGWLFEETKNPGLVRLASCMRADTHQKFGSVDNGLINLGSLEQTKYVDDVIPEGWGWPLAALAIINTPRVIGRRQFMPNRALERKLVAARGMVGKFPLHAWTEIRLKVSDPFNAAGLDVTEAHYTGERALHFCRAHLRFKLGRVEIVRSHWRGDPAIGIKQSRYKVVA